MLSMKHSSSSIITLVGCNAIKHKAYKSRLTLLGSTKRLTCRSGDLNMSFDMYAVTEFVSDHWRAMTGLPGHSAGAYHLAYALV